ncbi:MAG: Glu/Leu/Phe/Val dehydrogenase [Clostridiales bacterium]|nr:Glu/Leu/Phe/Val dehydrogenase [Candidatus Equinaster intestinalis]
MSNVEMIREFGHEEVAFFTNEKAGLRCIIAIHNTNLGPALGGCRLSPYASYDDALFDVLRLSRGMSFKNAAAGLPVGGGKGVIIADPSQRTPELMEAYGEAVESLQGRYYTAEDVNTDTRDIDYMMRKTKYVVGRADISGDPSPFTAIGVFEGIKATMKSIYGTDDLTGRTIAVQGLGKVGYDVAKHCHDAGANIVACVHSNRKAMEKAIAELGATEVREKDIFATECDVFAPCALGAIINQYTIPQLRCKAIAGGANNVLFDDACGVELKKKGIVYAPDFIINGGGVINAAQEAFTTYNKENVLKQVRNIYNTVYNILEESKSTGEPEGVIAQRFAEERLKNGLK